MVEAAKVPCGRAHLYESVGAGWQYGSCRDGNRCPNCRELLALRRRVEELEAAIRQHRDERGDDRCWMDDERLYAVLPEGYTPPARDTAVELDNCRKYIECRHNPATTYVSPQRRIEELEKDVETYKKCKNLWDQGMESLCEKNDALKQQARRIPELEATAARRLEALKIVIDRGDLFDADWPIIRAAAAEVKGADRE